MTSMFKGVVLETDDNRQVGRKKSKKPKKSRCIWCFDLQKHNAKLETRLRGRLDDNFCTEFNFEMHGQNLIS